MRSSMLIVLTILCGLSLLTGTEVSAQYYCETLWEPEGVQLSLLQDDRYVEPRFPRVIRDGSGGAFYAWNGSSDNGYNRLYMQRIDAGGLIQWATNGIDVSNQSIEDINLISLTPDGSGGVIACWSDSYYSYMQRLDANGVEQWSTGGVIAVRSSSVSFGPPTHRITMDGSGGAIEICKTNNIVSFEPFITSTSIRMQRVDGNGILHWGDNGILLSKSPDNTNHGAIGIISDGDGGAIYAYESHTEHLIFVARSDNDGTSIWSESIEQYAADELAGLRIVDDGSGGAIVSWTARESDIYTLRAQRFSADGTAMWATGGEDIVTETVERGSNQIASDGSGGAIITWTDNRLSGIGDFGLNIFAQRLDGTGTSQWAPDGQAVCVTDGDLIDPRITESGEKGAIICWTDARNPETDIYAQRMDSLGVYQWLAEGIAVCSEWYDQSYPLITGDEANGAIVTWIDYRLLETDHHEIYSQKIDAGGTQQWAAGGQIVCEYYKNDQQNIAIAPDGAEGAIMTWSESMGGIYMQRVDSIGPLLWGDYGITVCPSDWRADCPQVIPNGTEGAIAVWQDCRSSRWDIYAQQVDAGGSELWFTDDVAICTASGDQLFPQLTTDTMGGAIIVWQDSRADDFDVYAQRVDANGSIQWIMNGIGLCTAAGDQQEIQIIPDGSGGAILVWRDGRNSEFDIYAQRVDAAGAAQWTGGGTPICSVSGDQLDPQIIPDGTGGAIITWQDGRGTDYDIYAQRIDADGAVLWAADGVAVCTTWDDQLYSRLDTDGSGGAIIAWLDLRGTEIYAQRIGSNGSARWTLGGIRLLVNASVRSSSIPEIVSDGSGGAFIVVCDYNIMSQHVDSTGTYLWGPEGADVVSVSAGYPRIASDGAGGALIAWNNFIGNSFGQRFRHRMPAAIGSVLFVDQDATGTADGNSWENAFIDLQSALYTANLYFNDVDEIWVAEGTYRPTSGTDRNESFHITCTSVSIYGGFAGGETALDERDLEANVTVLSGDIGTAGSSDDNSYHVVTVAETDTSTVLDGFVVAGGNGTVGAGLYATTPLTLRNCFFRENRASGAGGGLYLNTTGYALISNVTFMYNSAEDGGGMYTKADGYISNVTFIENVASEDGAGMYHSSSAVLANALFNANRAHSEGGALYSISGSGRFVNLTCTNNIAYKGGAIRVSSCTITNSILWGNTSLDLTDEYPLHEIFKYVWGTTIVSHSIVDGCGGSGPDWNNSFGIDGGGNLDANPLFVDAGAGNVRLYENSPAVNAGDNTADDLPLYDLAGNQRIQDGTVDMGVYENWHPDFQCPTGSILYVDKNATGACDGSSWADAFTEVRTALPAAAACGNIEEIWVAEGTYKPTDTLNIRPANLRLLSGLALYGGFSGTELVREERDIELNTTVLSGNSGSPDSSSDNSYNVVSARYVDSTAVLDGFTISDGYADYGSEYGVNRGAGIFIYSGDPTLANLIISNNHASSRGGGIFLNSSDPVLANFIISNNDADISGGGLYCTYSAPKLDNVIFEHNTARTGGGMTNHLGHPVLSNVQFVENAAITIGGAVNNDQGDMTISNVSFRNNDGTLGGAFCNYNDSYVASHATMTDVTFIENTGSSAGALFNYNSHLELTNGIFIGNTADGDGIFPSTAGAIYNDGTLSLTNGMLFGNSAKDAGGINCYDGRARLLNVTISGNAGTSSILNRYDSDLEIINSIIWDNDVPSFSEIYHDGDSCSVSHSLIEGCYVTQGSSEEWNEDYGIDLGNNLDENPYFVDPVQGNFRLLAGSPAIDAGDSSVAGLPTGDLLGNPRIVGETVDMGTYEGAVEAIDVTIATEPPGFEVIVAGEAHISPYTFPSCLETEIEIGVISPQFYQGDDYYFVAWSDGGDTTHVVTLPDSNVTFTVYFSDVITDDEVGQVPLVNALHQNHPNPFNPSTTIRFSLKSRSNVSLTVYDVAGRLVNVLVDDVMDAGPHDVTWDGRGRAGRTVASGVYFYRLRAGKFIETRKMVLLR